MNGLAEFAQGNISLGVFSGSETVFIMTAGTLANFPHVPETGMTTPVFETATGRALLSMLSSQELDHKLGEIKSDYPDAIAHNAPKIISGIESCKARGFCTSFGDWRKNIYGVSAPVGRAAGGLCVTLTCGVPSYRSHRRDIESDLGPRLTSVAEDLRLLDAFTT